ncbi:alpha/beta hydrolase [Pseudomonas putida]|uniref:alpha/beta hydrolase n=1 Tax=Pseudomonas putida TaxID=303 RepID=UPI00104E31A9|nr:alpha/beta hydrolase [Pseudomonas putida]
MIEQTTTIEGVEILYMRKPARYDTKHLVIVFSGFSGNGKPTYNYHNSFSECPAEVIWIKDSFQGGESYYLCSKGQFNIENAVFKFISIVMKELDLDTWDCTLLGSSKGGSAAMYYGFKYNFGNIIASVPQFHIGTYVEADWPYALKHMTSGLPANAARDTQGTLDRMITEAISASLPNKNVYLITSLADSQYETEIAPNIDQLKKFTNFNLIMANSQMIEQHNQVSRHTIAIAISIVNLSAMGIPPKLPQAEIKYRKLSPPKQPSLKPIVALKKFKTQDGNFFPEGISVLRGAPCPDYSDIKLRLLLKNNEDTVGFLIAKDHKPDLTRELFDGDLVKYDKGWFCTLGHKGLPIDDLPIGKWSAHIEISCRGHVRQAPMISASEFTSSGEGHQKRMKFTSNATESYFTVTQI